ncbi:hypothetical protein [Chitinophaga ginsengisoli]|uniref:hypothetical protein n=1 Tax=Chitinophaga ginsengisoli TaxID=363837 RepID=UPI0014762859|nr:hypothetical protein [Chitinophaga ginsengisoli]
MKSQLDFIMIVKSGAKINNHDLKELLSGRLLAKLAINIPPPAPAILSCFIAFEDN